MIVKPNPKFSHSPMLIDIDTILTKLKLSEVLCKISNAIQLNHSPFQTSVGSNDTV